MLKIHAAGKEDSKEITGILKKLDLFYPSLSLTDFWVAEKDQKIIGTIQLRKYKDFFFLSALGVLEKERNQGIARALMNEALSSADKNIYLYTIIPEFFKKFGFQITSPIPGLPQKNQYECEYCHPEKCVCMVKRPHAA
jgi:N-acetylglutamate synthase-like GNAT family acetyltransferase